MITFAVKDFSRPSWVQGTGAHVFNSLSQVTPAFFYRVLVSLILMLTNECGKWLQALHSCFQGAPLIGESTQTHASALCSKLLMSSAQI